MRPTLAYRKKAWIYYAALVIDPILRFNWIFYAIYTSDAQHSSIVSFLVGFTEVLRRGMWTLFRVENEHCTNIERQKASRDIPLPYKIMEQDSTSRLITTPQSEDEEDTDKTVRRDHATAPFSPPGKRLVLSSSACCHALAGFTSAAPLGRSPGLPRRKPLKTGGITNRRGRAW